MTTQTTLYIAGFTVATGAKFYVFRRDGSVGQEAKPCLFADRAEALKRAEQAARVYPLHAVSFVTEAAAQ